jgi:hypothetical protein
MTYWEEEEREGRRDLHVQFFYFCDGAASQKNCFEIDEFQRGPNICAYPCNSCDSLISLTFGSNEELVPYYYSKLTLDGDVVWL